MRRLTHFLVLAAFIFSCGGQWYALQCIAWGKMIHDYSEVVPLTEAIGMTFSGQYPCEICRAIAEKKSSDDSAKILAIDKYAKKFFPPVSITAVSPAEATFSYAEYLNSLQARTEAPPTPPPRLA